MARRTPKKHFSVQIKDKAIQVLFLAGGLLFASFIFNGSSNPILKAAALGFRMPAGLVFLLGVGIWVVGHLLRPRETPMLLGHPMKTEWSAQVFQDIEWKRFETLCAELFAQAGFEARTQSHGADGGVDIVLHSSNASGPAAIVQCKHWPNRLVGVKELRELLGVMAANRITRGTFATSGGFTQQALRFAQQNKIHALDGRGLLALISKRSPEQQLALLGHAYQGEYWRPTCASCGSKLVERTARQRGSSFWGCPAYPRCRFRLPMRAN